MARYSVDYDGNLDTTDDRVSYGSFDAAVGGIGDRGFQSYGVQDNRRGGGGNLGSFDIGGQDTPGGRAGAGWSALNDARQVGGGGLGNLFGGFTPGRAIGGLLGGLIAGPIGGLVGAGIGGGMGGGRGGWGYVDAQGNQVSAGRDMIDGGGPGRSGDRFEGGGLLSAAGNALGIRPAGYRDRQEMQSQMSADQVRAGIGSAGGIPPVGVTDLTGTSESLPPIVGPISPQPVPSSIPLSAQPGVFSPPPGMTPFPSLTAEQIAALAPVGMGSMAIPGDRATLREIAQLEGSSILPPAIERPYQVDQVTGGRMAARPPRLDASYPNPPNAYAPNNLTSLALNPAFQGNSNVNVGQYDLYSPRVQDSARNRMMFNTGLLGR